MIEDFDYTEDVSIDESALDIEWLRQPTLIMRYTKIEAQADRALDKAKEQLNIVEAEMYQDIADNPDAYDLPKTTEGAIQGAIIQTENYKEAKKKVSNARYELDMARAAVKAMYSKKDALEHLVRLHFQQYFAGPSVPRDLGEEWEKKKKQQESNQKVGKKLKRRRTK